MPQLVQQFGSAAAVYAMHDEAILGHQQQLVERVVEGTIDEASFLRNIGHLESFESFRASLRGDGAERRASRHPLQPSGPEEDHYRMHFADGSSPAVAPLNEAERRVYSRGDGAWSGLMEKAVAQKLDSLGRDIKGGLSQTAISLLKGADCEVSFLSSRTPGSKVTYRDPANLGRLLETTLSSGKAAFTQVNQSDFDPEVSIISDAKRLHHHRL